jgi:hypothetical protein
LFFFEEIKIYDICSGFIAEYGFKENNFTITETFGYQGNIKGQKIAPDVEILKYALKSEK